jgi:hypothetical protein
MGVVLPSELTWVLNLIGVNWPNVDEDQLRDTANQLRSMASDLENNNGDAISEVEQMLGVNSAQSLTNFNALWQMVATGHLPQLGEGLGLFATGMDIAAVIIEGMKLAAIVQLGILAAEIIADQAAAVETFGASEALAAAQTEITEQIVKQALNQAVQAVEQQLTQVVEGPIFNALESAAQQLGGQLLGDALGTQSGVDLGAVVSAGESGLSQGIQQSAQQVTGMAKNIANDPLGSAESVITDEGVPTS